MIGKVDTLMLTLSIVCFGISQTRSNFYLRKCFFREIDVCLSVIHFVHWKVELRILEINTILQIIKPILIVVES